MKTFFQLVVLACGLAACAPSATVPSQEDVRAGEALFLGRTRSDVVCAACHGTDARGGKIGPDLRSRAGAASDDSWVTTILDGEDAMPSYRGKLDDRDVRKIIAWLTTKQ